MARVALCDRCGTIIKDFVIKQVRFAPNPASNKVYDVCDKCYDKLKECMETHDEDNND